MTIKEKLSDYLSLYAATQHEVQLVIAQQQALAQKLANLHNKQEREKEEIALLVMAAELTEQPLLAQSDSDRQFSIFVEPEDELYGSVLDLGANGYWSVTITELRPFLTGEKE